MIEIRKNKFEKKQSDVLLRLIV